MYMYTYIDLSLFFSSELHGHWAWSVMNALTYLPELWGGEAGTPLVEAWGVLYGLVGLVPLWSVGDPIPLVNDGLWKKTNGGYIIQCQNSFSEVFLLKYGQFSNNLFHICWYVCMSILHYLNLKSWEVEYISIVRK